MNEMFLTDIEVDQICEGLGPNSHAAKAKRLKAMGLIVNRKPNGRPLVLRVHAEAVLSGRPDAANEGSIHAAEPQLNTAGIVALFGRKRAA